MTPTFEQESIRLALKQLLEEKPHFCIIDFRAVLKVAGVVMVESEDNTLHLLHCVSYDKMGKGMVDQLRVRIITIVNRSVIVKLDDKFEFATDYTATERAGRRFAEQEIAQA